MCTVTFIPVKDGAIITSNRDEHINRGIALHPEFYILNDRKLAFPRDTKAGGTWFISNENGDTGVLLNGAFEKHIPAASYRKSRGLVLTEIFQHESPFEALIEYNYSGIENFTIILWEQKELREVKWGGNRLSVKKYDPRLPHIWSSVTLYDKDMMLERHGWFNNWVASKSSISQQHVLGFHSNTGANNKEYGLRISSCNKITTTSTTSLCVQNKKARLYHKDHIGHIESLLDYDLQNFRSYSSPLKKKTFQ